MGNFRYTLMRIVDVISDIIRGVQYSFGNNPVSPGYSEIDSYFSSDASISEPSSGDAFQDYLTLRDLIMPDVMEAKALFDDYIRKQAHNLSVFDDCPYYELARQQKQIVYNKCQYAIAFAQRIPTSSSSTTNSDLSSLVNRINSILQEIEFR